MAMVMVVTGATEAVAAAEVAAVAGAGVAAGAASPGAVAVPGADEEPFRPTVTSHDGGFGEEKPGPSRCRVIAWANAAF